MVVLTLIACLMTQVQPSAEEQIRRLAAEHQYAQALEAYDRAIAAKSHVPDRPLLALIARPVLVDLSKDADPTLATMALERLARGGEAGAVKTLTQLAGGQPSSELGREASYALLRLGDREATARAGSLLDAAPPDRRATLIQALEHNRATAAGAAIVEYLDDPAPEVRAVAARAAGALGVRAAVPKLQRLFASDVPTVKSFAGIALRRLGQPTADAFVAGLLASQIASVRLDAAEAYSPAESRVWLGPVRELRTSQNPLERVRVAERLACCEPATSSAILNELLASPVPMVRAEAARALEATSLMSLPIARRLLNDANAMPRLYAAGSVTAAQPARSPARK